jgi:palmitoyltransferase
MAQDNTSEAHQAAAPAQPSSKSSTAAPKLNHEMEMGNLPGDDVPVDIMQVARIGDIAAMEKLFESGDYDATYTDDEGITPLHVCPVQRTKLSLSLLPQFLTVYVCV